MQFTQTFGIWRGRRRIGTVVTNRRDMLRILSDDPRLHAFWEQLSRDGFVAYAPGPPHAFRRHPLSPASIPHAADVFLAHGWILQADRIPVRVEG